MELFETESETFYDRVCALIPDDGEAKLVEVGENDVGMDIIDVNEQMDFESVIASLSTVFERNMLNKHLTTVKLLGDLSLSDVFLYYCIVTDCITLKKESGDRVADDDVVKPEEYVDHINDASLCSKYYELNISFPEKSIEKLRKIVEYIRSREFRILSNTFYLDGTDFIIFLMIKSTVDYNLRLKIVIRCASKNEAKILARAFNGNENEEMF